MINFIIWRSDSLRVFEKDYESLPGKSKIILKKKTNFSYVIFDMILFDKTFLWKNISFHGKGCEGFIFNMTFKLYRTLTFNRTKLHWLKYFNCFSFCFLKNNLCSGEILFWIFFLICLFPYMLSFFFLISFFFI